MKLFDSNDAVLKTTDWSFSGLTENEFDGFIDGNTYSVIAYGEDQYGRTFQTTKETFIVDYASPNLTITPSA